MTSRIKRIVAALAAIAIIAGVAAYFSGAFRARPILMADIGGPFVLASSKGGTLDSASLAGHPYAVFFGYTHCPEVCPTTLYEMSSTLDRLGAAAKDFRVFFITVDPERDTAALLADYLSNFDPRIEGLVPTPAELQSLASNFRIYYARQPDSSGGYTMDHTAMVFLMGADGKFSGTIAFGEAAEMREAKLRRLLAAP